MYFKQPLLLGVLFLCLSAGAQENSSGDAYTFSISGSGAALSNLFSVNNNQAGLAFYRKTAFAINYSNKYFIPELAAQSAIGTLSIGQGTIGASIFHFGAKSLHESKYSLAYGRKLFKWLGAGIEMNYQRFEVEAVSQNGSTISGNIGLQAILKEGLVFGLQLENPTNSRFTNSENYVLYSGLKTGISYSIPASFLITSQLDWDRFQKIAFIAGGEYWLIKNFSVRFGIKLIDNPGFSFGTGIIYRRIAFDFGFERHPVLGLSTSFSIIIQLKSNER
jgi:hypothetical protein